MAVLEVVKDDATWTLTLNRPNTRNAIDRELADALDTALSDFESDPDSRVAVITGSGGHFCAGMDLAEFLNDGIPLVGHRGFAGIAARMTTKPLVAAVEGPALAGGFEIALACDLLVASTTAVFGLPEVKLGLVAAAGGLIRLPRRLPYHVATRLVLTGETIDAATADRYGLLSLMTEPGAALSEAIELARLIARNGPLAVSASREVMRDSRTWLDEEMFDRQAPITDPVFRSRDAAEGARAFLEKRRPVWSAS